MAAAVRVVRRFGAAWRRPGPRSASRWRRPRPSACGVVRRFGAAVSTAAVASSRPRRSDPRPAPTWTDSVTRSPERPAVPAPCPRPGRGACASSSGGTSLHGSLDVPRLGAASAGADRRAAAGHPGCRLYERSSRGRGLTRGPAADVGVAVDTAPAAAPAVALAIDRRLVGRAAAARTTAPGAAAGTAASAGVPVALGDEVLGDLRLVEVLVIGDRTEVRRSAAAVVPSCESQTDPNGVERGPRGATGDSRRPRPRRAGMRSLRCSGRAACARRVALGGVVDSADARLVPSKTSSPSATSVPSGLVTTAATTTAASTAASSAARALAGIVLAVDGRSVPTVAAVVLDGFEREDLGVRQVGLGQAAAAAPERESPAAAVSVPLEPAAVDGRPRPRPPRAGCGRPARWVRPRRTATATGRVRGRDRRRSPRSACRGPRSSTGPRRRRRPVGRSASPSRPARAG